MGNQTETSFIKGTYTTAMPAAIIIFPSTIIQKLPPNDVIRDPIEATTRNAVDTTLGPKRSVSRPHGICIAVYVQKYTLLRMPMVPPTSSTMSDPTTLTDIRWK